MATDTHKDAPLPGATPVSYFDSICEFVENTYSDLLGERERQWLVSLSTLSISAKTLYVRLLGRSYNTFRQSKLSYEDVADLNAAVIELHNTTLITDQPPIGDDELTKLFTKPELVELFGRPELKNKKKADLIDAIYSAGADHAKAKLKAADQWITIEGHDVYAWFLLCFFGNRYQDTTEFVLSELGHVRYFPYTIDRSTRAFDSREQIEAHLRYYEIASLYEHADRGDANALLGLSQSLPQQTTRDPTLTRRIDRIRIRLARQLERLERRDEALKLYQQCQRAPARERMVRIYMQQENYQSALSLLNGIESTPYCDEELQFVVMMRPKLARLMGDNVKAKRFKPISAELTLNSVKEEHPSWRVERVAQEHYQQQGECFYVENNLFNAVLGLLIWDEIFAALSGAFFNPFQFAPADFYDPVFYQRREQALEDRLCTVNNDQFKAEVLTRYKQYHGYANPLVRWGYVSAELLEQALNVIPKEHWQVILKRQLQDLKHNTTGLPDLIHFPNEGGYQLIEIKGPGDAVQKNQNRWFAYFEANDIPYQVVHIKWAHEPTAV